MSLSKETLLSEASATGFRPDVLEKVHYLLDLLEVMNENEFLRDRLALKGGTALNLFIFELPRLSVDIDLNYVGAADKETMLVDREEIERLLPALSRRVGLYVQTPRREYALTSWALRYESVLGGADHVKAEINFVQRVPLWPPVRLKTCLVGTRQISDILVLDEHELAGGKLAALLARRTGRDLFDAHALLTKRSLEPERLRLAFVLYGGMNIEDWRKMATSDIDKAVNDLDRNLMPLLRQEALDTLRATSDYRGEQLARECREALAAVLPLTEMEVRFLNRLNDEGEIEPEHLSADSDLSERIRCHPGLIWKAVNVKKHRAGQ
jgi:predicted nucleotidyltransferase component of viral defense system